MIDEATQVSTEDALRIAHIARRCGAMVIGTFDPGQLGAVDAGGIFPLIAARHGSYQLTEVRRFTHAWERDASLRVRDGDVAVMAEYAARGRVWHGPRDRVYDEAVMLWSNDHVRGRDTLLLAASNEEAARLARLAREKLAELGRISGADEITLADGNQAGRGDLVRARLNTRIEADGQTLANRDTIRIDGWQDSGFGRLAVVSRRTGAGEWSRQFFVPAAYLEQNAELDYAGNVHVAQGRTVDTGHLVVSEGMTRDQLYVGLSRGREKNTLHVVTGEPDLAQMSRAEREAWTDEAIRKAHALRQAGDIKGANAVSFRPPDLPTDRQAAPWEAVVAQVMQRADAEGTALEQIQAAQDYTTNTGHLLQLSEAFWRLDVVPKIDAMVRDRIGPREFARYLADPERPAFLQAVREHEIGGRPIPDLLDAITAEPLGGLRSIAAGLHGRAGKLPAPARGETAGWAERAPRDAAPEITAAGQMMDGRQGELGRQLAGRPPEWALRSWGVPPAEAGAERAEWERLAGIVGSYREVAGITDPAHPIGPPPSAQAQVREAWQAAVRALRLPDDEALLRAMGQGELEQAVAEGARIAAAARPDVQAEVGERQDALGYAQARAEIARGHGDTEPAADAEAEAGEHAGELARLAVADAARREWAEANAAKLAEARAAEAELRRRDQAGRVPEAAAADERQAGAVAEETGQTAQFEPESEAEFLKRLHRMVYGSEPEPEPEAAAEPEPEPEARGWPWQPEHQGETEAEFAGRLEQVVAEAEARRQARTETAETEAEAEAEAGQDRAEAMAAIREEIEAIGAKVDQLAGLNAERDAERRAEMDQAGIDEPVAHEPQPEVSLEPSWQPGNAQGYQEPSADTEPEMEIG